MPTTGPSRLEGSIDPTEEIGNPNATRADTSGFGLPNTRSQFTRPDSFLEGWVWKKSRYFKRWKKRYLVLTPKALVSYEKKGDPKPTWRIDAGSVLKVMNLNPKANKPPSQRGSICIKFQVDKYFNQFQYFDIACEESETEQQWMREIKRVLAKTLPCSTPSEQRGPLSSSQRITETPKDEMDWFAEKERKIMARTSIPTSWKA